MTWLLLAASVPLLLLAYQLFINWVNVFPWNDASVKTLRERTLETGLNYAPLLLISFAFFRPSLIGVLWAMIGSYLYLLGHLNAWWRPYFFGASAKEQQDYLRLFQRTYKILPPIGNNPIPDVEHIVLGLIVVGMCLCSTLAYLTYR